MPPTPAVQVRAPSPELQDTNEGIDNEYGVMEEEVGVMEEEKAAATVRNLNEEEEEEEKVGDEEEPMQIME